MFSKNEHLAILLCHYTLQIFALLKKTPNFYKRFFLIGFGHQIKLLTNLSILEKTNVKITFILLFLLCLLNLFYQTLL